MYKKLALDTIPAFYTSLEFDLMTCRRQTASPRGGLADNTGGAYAVYR